MVFVQIEKKSGYRWYLWAFQSATAIAFELDPSRSHRVPDGHFQGVEGGILLVDRYSGYKAMELVKDGTILLAFCWAHVRRDFIRIGKNWPKLAAWALEWLLEIRELYHLNRPRLCRRHDPAAFAELDRRLREAVDAMAAKARRTTGPEGSASCLPQNSGEPQRALEGADALRRAPGRAHGQQSHRTHAARPGGRTKELLRLGGAVEREIGGDALLFVFHAEAPCDQPPAMVDCLLGGVCRSRRQSPRKRRRLPALEHDRGGQGDHACPFLKRAGREQFLLTARPAKPAGINHFLSP